MNKKVYEYTQILMAYHDEKMEGCASSFDECAEKFRNRGDCEVSRHFKLFDYMLETQQDMVTEELILKYHSIMADGGYRTCDTSLNRIRGDCAAKKIPEKMESLIANYVGLTFGDIAAFLAEYEHIQPFGEQCSVVGKMIMYKECLRLGLPPVVVYTTQRMGYSISLSRYDRDPKNFKRTLRRMRTRYMHDIENLQ